jgi:hypothetical protein
LNDVITWLNDVIAEIGKRRCKSRRSLQQLVVDQQEQPSPRFVHTPLRDSPSVFALHIGRDKGRGFRQRTAEHAPRRLSRRFTAPLQQEVRFCTTSTSTATTIDVQAYLAFRSRVRSKLRGLQLPRQRAPQGIELSPGEPPTRGRIRQRC